MSYLNGLDGLVDPQAGLADQRPSDQIELRCVDRATLLSVCAYSAGD